MENIHLILYLTKKKEKYFLRILDGLDTLHKLAPLISGDVFSFKRKYIDKTFNRLKKVRGVITLKFIV